jgi:hypothetical protein
MDENRARLKWRVGMATRVPRTRDSQRVELARSREYIANNPLQWELDRENPAVMMVAAVSPS